MSYSGFMLSNYLLVFLFLRVCAEQGKLNTPEKHLISLVTKGHLNECSLVTIDTELCMFQKINKCQLTRLLVTTQYGTKITYRGCNVSILPTWATCTD